MAPLSPGETPAALHAYRLLPYFLPNVLFK